MTAFNSDSSITPTTPNFGLTRIGSGETFDKNGWAFTDHDRLAIDALLQALATHSHSGTPALSAPTDPPNLTVATSGGELPPATDYFYRVSYIDARGLETAAGPEGSTTTPDPVQDATLAPALTVNDGDGSLPRGTYSYVYTFGDTTGGQTLPGDNGQITVGVDSSSITIDLPDLVAGAMNYNIYRARPGQNNYYFLTTTTDSEYVDSGVDEDQTVMAPVENTTAAANSIVIEAPNGFLPPGAVGWRIYRASDSGAYNGDSLVHEVVETVDSSSDDIRTFWTDVDDLLAEGQPRETSNTIPDLAIGATPGSTGSGGAGPTCISVHIPGEIDDGEVLTVFGVPQTWPTQSVSPRLVEAFWRVPSIPDGTTTITLTGNNGEVRIFDMNHRFGDPVGYYHQGFAAGAALTMPVTVTARVALADGTPTPGSDLQLRIWI